MGALIHVPVEAERALPSSAVPLITGSAIFAGGAPDGGCGAVGAGATTLDGLLVAEAEPPALVAVTTMRSVEPTSVVDRPY